MNNFEFYLEKAIQEREVINEKNLTNTDEQKIISWTIKNYLHKFEEFPNLWEDFFKRVKEEKPSFGPQDVKTALLQALKEVNTEKTHMSDINFILEYLKDYKHGELSLSNFILNQYTSKTHYQPKEFFVNKKEIITNK